MTDEELRRLVRLSIARQLDLPPGTPLASDRFDQTERTRHGAVAAHASHGVYDIARDAGDEAPCIIEPSVACTHCNYCKSHGH